MNGGLVFCDGHPVGPSATLRFSDRPRRFRLLALSCQYAVQENVFVRRVGERTLAVRPLNMAPPVRDAAAFGDFAKTMRTIGEAPKTLRDDHDG